MESGFWLERWQQGQIAFHQPHINPDLKRHWPQLGCPPEAAVFVPLCGKSEDLCWLRSLGHPVVGVELSDLAVQGFYSERGLPPQRSHVGSLECWAGNGYQLYVGDFFDLGAPHLAGVRAVYDRAALIALPAPLRRRYADHLAAILAPGTRMLLITMDYPQQQMAGPPFSVPDAEVHSLFDPAFSVSLLATRDTLADEPRFRERGLRELKETAYLLERKAATA